MNRECENIDAIQKLYRSESFEVCGVKDLETGLNICCCYRSPNDKNFDSFIRSLEKLLEHFIDRKCVICGDFNVDILAESKKSLEFISILTSYNFRHLINTPTFIRNKSYSCIDNVLTNLSDDDIEQCLVDHNGLADGHGGLLCNIILDKIDKKTNESEHTILINKRTFNTRNNAAFKKCFQNTNDNIVGINTFLNYFNKTFRACYPKKTSKVKLRNNNQIKWITKGIKVSSKMKRILCSGTTINTSVYNYKMNYVRIYRRVLKHARKLAISCHLNKAKNILKETWKIVNDQTKRKQNKVRRKLVLNIDNKVVTDPQEIADTFVDIFVYKSSLSKTEEERAMSFLRNSTLRVESEITFNMTTPQEITKIVRKMTNKASCGHDDVPILVIKDNIDILAYPLSEFINKCIEKSVFPEQLKLAKVVPLHKKGTRTDPKNYRPISLLPILSKIFEKILKTRLVTHLHLNRIINFRQFGYQKGIGTSDAIDNLVNDIISKLNNKMKVAGLFIDLSSAFDTVDHELLLAKLEHYGIRGKALQLLTSYLKNRRMYVEIKDINSNNCDVKCVNEVIYKSKMTNISRGVPQGSILGPILYLIFTNDLLNFMNNTQPDAGLIMFADDTNAIIGSSNLNELTENVNKCLKNLSVWFTANNLIINPNKTNVMLFKTTSRNKDSIDVKLKKENIGLVNEVKFLGVFIDSLLNWKKELTAIDSSISSACYALRSLRDDIDLKQLKSVYYALVESRLRYSIMFWGSSYGYNCQRAFILQKRALRTIVRIPQQESCKEYFKKLAILTVPSLYVLVILSHFAKYIHEHESQEERELREKTRRNVIKNKIAPKLNITKHCSKYQAVELFNKLPTDLRSLIYKGTLFKAKLKAFLLNKCLYSLTELVTNDGE